MFDTIIIILAILYLIVLYEILRRSSYINFAVIYGTLFFIFYLLPGLNIVYQLNLFEFRLFSFNYSILGKEYIKQLLILAMSTSMAFLIGYGLRYPKEHNTENLAKANIRGTLGIFCLSVYFLSILIFVITVYEKSGFSSLYQLFLPSRKEGLITSGYTKLLGFLLPTAMLIYANEKKLNKGLRYFLNGTGLLVLMISGQRRFIINYLLITIFYALKKYKKNLKKIIIPLLLSIMLIPSLWYLRSASTQVNRGVEVSEVNLTRSITYLIFGSSSSGFESLLFYELFKEELKIESGHSIKYVLASPFPRKLWSDKPSSISSLVRERLNYDGNPSIFYSNEMILNFGLLAIPISLILGFLIAFLQSRFNLMEVILFISTITFFKNGFSYFLTEVVFLLILYGLLKQINRMRR